MIIPQFPSVRRLSSFMCLIAFAQIIWWNRLTQFLDVVSRKNVEKRYAQISTATLSTERISNSDTDNTSIVPTSLAIVVAGSAQRLLFNSTVHHFIHSLIQNQEIHVDYLAAITLQSGPAFRQASEYMGHLAYDPLLAKAYPPFQNPKTLTTDPTDDDVKKVQSALQHAMAREIELVQTTHPSVKGSAKLRALKILARPLEDDPILDQIRAQTDGSDVFAQFPMMDLRSKTLVRTNAGNKNMIRLFLLLESLWKDEVEAAERKKGHKYDYILFLRDDTLWLADFDLNKLLATNPSADAYILSCNARDPAMVPPEVNDHGMLIKRDKAAVIGKYVTTLIKTDLKKCHDLVEPLFGKIRGCNSEMILKHILKVNNITVQLVPQSLLPFERAVVVEHNNGTKEYCFHKFCQSKEEPLELPLGMRKCKDISSFQ